MVQLIYPKFMNKTFKANRKNGEKVDLLPTLTMKIVNKTNFVSNWLLIRHVKVRGFST